MNNAEIFFILLGLAVLGAQVWLTVRVWRSQSYDRKQKVNQTRLIWFVPVLGAALLWALMPPDELTPRRSPDDRDTT